MINPRQQILTARRFLASRLHIAAPIMLATLFALTPGIATAQQSERPLAEVNGGGSSLLLTPNAPAESWVLTVTGPDGYSWRQVFEGQAPSFSASDLPEGNYSYQLRAVRRDASGPTNQSGSFSVAGGAITSVEKPAPVGAQSEDPLQNVGRDADAVRLDPVVAEDDDPADPACVPGTAACETGANDADGTAVNGTGFVGAGAAPGPGLPPAFDTNVLVHSGDSDRSPVLVPVRGLGFGVLRPPVATAGRTPKEFGRPVSCGVFGYCNRVSKTRVFDGRHRSRRTGSRSGIRREAVR